MSGKEKRPSADVDPAALEREIRQGRKFSMEEAIARRAGKDLMKGASPVSQQRQAALAIERFLDSELIDGEGALAELLLRQARESEVLFRMGYQQPLAALAQFIEGILASPGRLEQFVTQVDAYWGQMYHQRPYFQHTGDEPDADDPYTLTSVHAKLTRLLETLQAHS